MPQISEEKLQAIKDLTTELDVGMRKLKHLLAEDREMVDRDKENPEAMLENL